MRLPNQIRDFQRILADFSARHKGLCPTNILSLKIRRSGLEKSNPPKAVSQPQPAKYLCIRDRNKVIVEQAI